MDSAFKASCSHQMSFILTLISLKKNILNKPLKKKKIGYSKATL